MERSARSTRVRGNRPQTISRLNLAGLAVLLAAIGTAPAAAARDGFEKVRCGSDIAKALIGQRGFNEPVVTIESRHKDLDLKDLGASDYDSFSSITWMICGKEFMVLEDNRTNVFRDVLQIPPHSKSNPEFQGRCKLKGKLMPDSVVAILRDQGSHNELPATRRGELTRRSSN